MDIGDGERENIRLAKKEERHRARGQAIARFGRGVFASGKEIHDAQKSKVTTFKKGTVPSIGYSGKLQERAVRDQFGRPLNDRKPASSNILRGGSEFFNDDDGPRYLK